MAAPLLLGLLTAGGVVVLQMLPTDERIAELDSRLQDVLALRAEVPLMRQRLDAAENKLEQAQVQQALLLDLIAGRERIQTFLALLDQRARTAGVEIQRLEPLPEVSLLEDSQSRPLGSSDQASSDPVDPLQDLGYRRTALALNVIGYYNQLHYFLKGMEKLEVVVEASDLKLEAVSEPEAESGSKAEAASGVKKRASNSQQKIELSLRFSFYDYAPANEVNTLSTVGSAEQPLS